MNCAEGCEALFLPAEPGFRFGLYFPPCSTQPRGGVLYCPPFAEEMNKSRRMAALQARAFAKAGYGVLLLDLYGCGDSSGDFSDAKHPGRRIRTLDASFFHCREDRIARERKGERQHKQYQPRPDTEMPPARLKPVQPGWVCAAFQSNVSSSEAYRRRSFGLERRRCNGLNPAAQLCSQRLDQ